jgi:ribosomal protein S18 acetylase RimI-like enzyme
MIRTAMGKEASGIRALRPASDLGQLADLLENAFGEELTDGGERVLRELRLLHWLGPLNILFMGASSDIDGILTGFVWEDEGRIVGNVTVNHPGGSHQRWQISNVGVLEEYRGQGIARRLVDAALGLILRRGGQTAYLFVRDNNPAAIHLYQAAGFVEVDRTTELRYTQPIVRNPEERPRRLRPLTASEGEALYQLIMIAAGPGQLWLSPAQKAQIALSKEERFLRRLESVFTGELETQWGLFSQDRLDAGLILRSTRLWNRGPHVLRLWIHPQQRGKVEDVLADDVFALLGTEARRPTHIPLPAGEDRASDALVRRGFERHRTLVLMKLDL